MNECSFTVFCGFILNVGKEKESRMIGSRSGSYSIDPWSRSKYSDYIHWNGVIRLSTV
jgi:hypothetical protein